MPKARALVSPEPPRPFTDDAAGSEYLRSDAHLRTLVATISGYFSKTRGFVILVGDPPANGELIARHFESREDSGYRASLVRCSPAMAFADLVRAYCQTLGLTGDSSGDSAEDVEWKLLTHIMQEARSGVVRVLVIDNADALDAPAFEELLRFTQVDEPNVMPVLLLATPAFVEVVEAPAHGTLRAALVGAFHLQSLQREEVAAFIDHQLRAYPADGRVLFSAEAVEAIAAAANGDPAVVNRMARLVLARAQDQDTRPAAPAPTAGPTSATAAETPGLASVGPSGTAAETPGSASAGPSGTAVATPDPASAASSDAATTVTSFDEMRRRRTSGAQAKRRRAKLTSRVAVGVGLCLAAGVLAGAAVYARVDLLFRTGQATTAETEAPRPAEEAGAAPTDPSEMTTTTKRPGEEPLPTRSPQLAASAGDTPRASAEPPAMPPAASSPLAGHRAHGYRLQLGAMRTPAAAAQEWERLKREHPDLLGTLEYGTQRVDLGERGAFYRVQAGPIADAAQAERRCAELKARGQQCLIVKQ